jgi:hypothetical protein
MMCSSFHTDYPPFVFIYHQSLNNYLIWHIIANVEANHMVVHAYEYSFSVHVASVADPAGSGPFWLHPDLDLNLSK